MSLIAGSDQKGARLRILIAHSSDEDGEKDATGNMAISTRVKRERKTHGHYASTLISVQEPRRSNDFKLEHDTL